ncbi:MAG: TlpA family protein disulfide reductase [Deltaproteobacteria bacterium]|nr:TlpA family protein disulfide reductase [Candidatus Zymogenaceae bacterium]
MNKIRKALSVSAVIFLVVLFVVISCGRQETPSEAGTKAAMGAVAPDFVLKSVDGKDVRLSDYRGRVVLLNFWATWCPPCRSEMPSIESLSRKMSAYDFVILAVSIDGFETSQLKNIISPNHYTFTVLHDPKQNVADIYLISGIPTTYIIDKDGVIVDKSVGAEYWDSEDRIKQLMSLVE